MKFRKIVLIYLFIFICILTTALLGYRYFIEIPRFEATLSLLHDRQLAALKHEISSEITRNQAVNYDYAVWDSNYRFMQQPNDEFIAENYGDPGFITLAYDGVFYLDRDFKQVFSKSYDHLTGKSYSSELFDFEKYPENKSVLPRQEYLGVPNRTGILSSQFGPVAFSATQIRHSDKSGENIGTLVFIHKLHESRFEGMSEKLNLNIRAEVLTGGGQYQDIPGLSLPVSSEGFSYQRQRLIHDINGKPVILLTIGHDKTITMELIDSHFIIVLSILLFLLLFGVITTNKLLVTRLELVIERMKEMATSNKLKPLHVRFNIYEMDKAAQRFNSLVEIVNKQKQLLEDLSLLDHLTKIANRRAFVGHIEHQWLLMQRNRSPLAVIMCDIDHFKAFNDFYGHQEGDEALAQVARALQNCMHRADDLVARYGGEEFVIVISNTDVDGLRHNVEKIVNCIRRLEIPHPASNTQIYVTISVGAAIYRDFSQIPVVESYQQVLHQADLALYAAKAAGRNRGMLYQDLSDKSEKSRVTLCQ
ncbi:diguanylate cyclase domain-containing protein [Thalassomonas actiniarum]|uniref:diguanylate cyclase n=1 Tax=Thalassomonas actiniarum TaxID=485447 RepID=A0AAF0C5Z8_9GAMM|nr:diguanylate cyclase [Thalassomonas actiniarum]WDE01440.1 diguanylate cyclase [Thalassomonas actiniarum]